MTPELNIKHYGYASYIFNKNHISRQDCRTISFEIKLLKISQNVETHIYA